MNRTKGFSLATVLILVTLVGGIASALLILSVNQSTSDLRTRDKIRAVALAEAGVEQMIHLLRRAHANAMNLTAPGRPVVVDGIDLRCEDLKGTDGIAETVYASLTIEDSAIEIAAERYLQIDPLPATDPAYDPLERQTTTLLYAVSGELRFRDGVLGRVERSVELKITPIFDKFAFWNGNLEILPGPAAIFNGRIHTNENLYIGAGTSLDLNTDYVRARGEMFRHRLDNPAQAMPGPLTLREPYADPYTAQGRLGADPWTWSDRAESRGDYNPAWDLEDSWLDAVSQPALRGKVRNNDNESAERLLLEPPAIDAIDVGGHYHNNADIVVRDTTVYRRTGNNPDGSPILQELRPGTDYPAAAITTTDVFDAREGLNGDPAQNNRGTPVPTTVIDMSLLRSGEAFPENGVIYAYRSNTRPAQGGQPRQIEGIALRNGATLAGDLTFVTNGPAYVWGDYNVDSPTGGPRKGAAVMADGVNLLSNGWDNSKRQDSAPPRAAATTYNFALVTGNTPTNDAMPAGLRYSGGLENLPRFHENWGGVNCNYQGALLCLWESKIATGRWGKGNVYSPPNRNWDFDARFGDPNSTAKPPLFPQTVHVDRTTYREGY